MSLDQYVNSTLTVSSYPPNLAPPDEIYYPTKGTTYQLVPDDDKFRWELIAEAGNGSAGTHFWNGAEVRLLNGDIDQPDPPHPDIDLHSKDRYYGIMYCLDRFFHIWFFEDDKKIDANGNPTYTCAALSLQGTFTIIKGGGYIH